MPPSRIPRDVGAVKTGVGTFHAGEREVQARAGVDAEARDLGRGISREIPAGAEPFLEAQRLAALAGVDGAGRVWASLVTGNPGFITAPDERTLRIATGLPAEDPLRAGLSPGQPLGVLVLDPERRRRLRINGTVIAADERAIEMQTREVFGNCPKYIQSRVPQDDTERPRRGPVHHGGALTAAQHLAVEQADTLFIATVHAGAGADASHRGGQPGFVRVLDEQTLLMPDYAGNNMFQTLGNIAADPRVGVLFVDFDTGTTLQLTGRGRLLWDPADLVGLRGAARAVEVRIDEIVEMAGHGPLGWRFREYSAFNPR